MPYTQMIAERVKFLAIDSGAVSDIREAREIIAPAIDRMLDRFYDHMLEQPDLRRLFVDRDTIDRARAGQKNHWLNSLFNGNYDNDFFERAEQIGRAHARVGLSLNWYIGGYCQMLGQFIELIADKNSGDKESATPISRSVCKAIFLDMDLVIQSYLDARDRTVRQVLRKATDFRADVATLSDALTETVTKMQGMTNALPEATHEETSKSNDAGREMNALVERLSQQVAQLDKRLNDVQYGERLYIHDDVAGMGPFARLKARILGRK